MFQWTPYPFIRYVGVLILGILFSLHIPIEIPYLPWILVGLALACYLSSHLILRFPRRRLSGLMGVLGLLLLFFFGVLVTRQRTDRLEPGHLLNDTVPVTHYQAILVSAIQVRANSYKAEAEVRTIRQHGKWKPAQGRMLLYVTKTSPRPAYGDLLLIRGQPTRIPPPANPGEFDYRQYLADQHIYHQHFLRATDFLTISHRMPNPIVAYAAQVGGYSEGVMSRAIGSKREYAIANALILGIKDDLDNEIMRAYAASGAMHVLSVSGLHVGILFLILSQLLGRLQRMRYGNAVFAGVILGMLWFYAFITALSPSVLRAVVMFSFVVIAQASRRKSNIYNTLALSAFLLLCWDPYYITSVGFQLSYLAVFGIVRFFPGLYRLLRIPDPYAEYRVWHFWKAIKQAPTRTLGYQRLFLSLGHKSLDWLWSVTCVSVAAQLVTFPLGLFYFHQFPNYFLLANPAVLLFSTLAMPLGLATVAFSWIPVLGTLMGFLLKWSIWLLNTSVFFTERLPYAVLSGIDIGPVEAMLVYFIMLTFLCLFEYRQFAYVWIVAGLVLVLAGINWREVSQQQSQRLLVVHSIRQHSVVSLIGGNRGWLLADSAFLKDTRAFNFHVANYWWGKGVSEVNLINLARSPGALSVHRDSVCSLLVWQGQRFLLLTAPLRGKRIRLPHYTIDYLVVQNNALRHLAEATDGLTVKQVVLDASNKPYLSASLSQEAARLRIPCYDAARSGSLIVSF